MPQSWHALHLLQLSSAGVVGDRQRQMLPGKQVGREGGRKRAHLVYEVDAGLGGEVAQQVQRPVQVEHDADLAPHAVVEPPSAVVVHERVAHPKACSRISLDAMLCAVACQVEGLHPKQEWERSHQILAGGSQVD